MAQPQVETAVLVAVQVQRGQHRMREQRGLARHQGQVQDAGGGALAQRDIEGEKNRVYTEGKGEKQPVADNKTKEGQAKNRRVEIEVVGTRTNK